VLLLQYQRLTPLATYTGIIEKNCLGGIKPS